MGVEGGLRVDCATNGPGEQPLAQLSPASLFLVSSLYVLDQLLGAQEDQVLGLGVCPYGAHPLESDGHIIGLGDRMAGSLRRHGA